MIGAIIFNPSTDPNNVQAGFIADILPKLLDGELLKSKEPSIMPNGTHPRRLLKETLPTSQTLSTPAVIEEFKDLVRAGLAVKDSIGYYPIER
jgi:hypothetical protein